MDDGRVGIAYILSDIAHCLFPCGMSHDPWNFLVSNKEAAVLIRLLGRLSVTSLPLLQLFFTLLSTPSQKDLSVEILTATEYLTYRGLILE